MTKTEAELLAEREKAQADLEQILNTSRPKNLQQGLQTGVGNILSGAVGAVGVAVLLPTVGMAMGGKKGGIVGASVGLVGGAVAGALGAAALAVGGGWKWSIGVLASVSFRGLTRLYDDRSGIGCCTDGTWSGCCPSTDHGPATGQVVE